MVFAAHKRTKERAKKTQHKFYTEFLNKITQNEKKNINNEIFNEYFKYQNPTFLLKGLSNANKNKNEKIADYVDDVLIDL